MAHYLNRGPIITITDPLHPGQYKQFRNPEWNELPEIISFTEFLRWNYTADYGRYIRELHQIGQLPLLYGIPPTAAIENVAIVEGKYDRIDHFTFFMYVICDVVFVVNGYRQNQKYCVQGYYKANGRSDFFSDIYLYTEKYIRCQNPLDEFLVQMSPTALLFVHDPSTIAMVNAKDMEKAITKQKISLLIMECIMLSTTMPDIQANWKSPLLPQILPPTFSVKNWITTVFSWKEMMQNWQSSHCFLNLKATRIKSAMCCIAARQAVLQRKVRPPRTKQNKCMIFNQAVP